jgi:hypothetical protein
VSTKKSDESGSTPAESATAEFELSLEATLEQQRRILPPGKFQSKGRAAGVDGYNPYDAVPAVKSDAAKPVEAKKRKPIDLRRLSEWIRTQRQVEALKKKEKEKP